MLTHPVQHVRLVGLLEGISYVLLLFVAMPLKYFADMPLAVRIVGSAHGALFIGLCIAIAVAAGRSKLPMKWSGLAFIASLLPFGPFIIDPKLRPFVTDSPAAQA